MIRDISGLTYMPAFGFETAAHNSGKSYVKEAQTKYHKELMESSKGLRSEVISLLDKEVLPDCRATIARDLWKKNNRDKISGYIPLYGIPVGISRLFAAYKIENTLASRVNHIARGIIEALSLGFLLIIPDLIVTAKRQWSAG